MPPLEQARLWLQQARRIAILTGAGISAESGVPTFRDAQTGLWSKFRPEELATEQAFRARPQFVWDWYAMRREMLAKVAPNAGHIAIAQFQQSHPGRATLVTQNVDGLHQRAAREAGLGGQDAEILALHGNIAQDHWLDPPRACCDASPPTGERPPRCATCGNLRRPSVVWFGEMLPEKALAAAQQAAAECELMVVVGTSGVVYPAAGLAHEAKAAGAKLVIVNPEESALDDIADAVVRGKAAQLLPQLLA